MGVREDFWSIYREALPVLFVALAGGLFAGLVLEGLLGRVERFSVVIGVLTWSALFLMGWESARLVELVGIMFLAGFLTSFVMIAGLLALIFAGFNYGYDPDNLVGPVVTTLGDIFGMLFLLFSVSLVEVLVTW